MSPRRKIPTVTPLLTPWGAALDTAHPLPEYPRPQLVRDSYQNLNGRWQYAITTTDATPTVFDGDIVVPFSPEALLSGVERQVQPTDVLHYRREFTLAGIVTPDADERVLLHFGAVDQRADVWLNDAFLGTHIGGYLPFSFDVTDALDAHEAHELRVVVHDPSDTTELSRGKQKLKRGGIWYTAQSGIWQTVWLERVPMHRIDRLSLVPQLRDEAVQVTVHAVNAAVTASTPAFAQEIQKIEQDLKAEEP